MQAIRLRHLPPFALALALFGCVSEQESAGASATVPDTDMPENSAPSIRGNPRASVRTGESYSFVPGASDPDGDTLTFSVRNKPVWAAFDSLSGALSGVPTLAHIGVHSNISISVTDGIDTADLPSFAVEVTQNGSASTTLSWTAPTMNEDGTVLSDLAGYKIYYGKSSGIYTNEIRIDNPGTTTYVVQNLTPDTYFVVATALNSNNIESRFSNEIIVSLN